MSDLKATLKTNRGDIVINLFPNHAPKTVENFVGLAEGTKDYQDDAGRSPASRSTTASASTASSTAS